MNQKKIIDINCKRDKLLILVVCTKVYGDFCIHRARAILFKENTLWITMNVIHSVFSTILDVLSIVCKLLSIENLCG